VRLNSCLKYNDVDIEGLSDTVTALNDSGCQLCVVRADTVRPLNLPILGQAKLRGLSDHLVPADIVRIRVRLTTGKGFINIACAVVEKLNFSLILGSDIVDKLNWKFVNENFDASEVMNVVNDENDDNDDADVDEKEVTNDNCDSENDKNENMCDPHRASAEILISVQKSDRSLIHCWSLAERQRAGYYVRDGIFYCNYK